MQATKLLEVVPVGEGRCLVTLFRFMDEKVLDMEMPVGASTFRGCLDNWRYRGALIQDAFPDLDADQREFLMTGITPAEWAEMFK